MKLRLMRKVANKQLRRRRHELRHNKDDAVLKQLVVRYQGFRNDVKEYITIRRALGNKSPEEFVKFADWELKESGFTPSGIHAYSMMWANARHNVLAKRARTIRKIFLS